MPVFLADSPFAVEMVKNDFPSVKLMEISEFE